MNAITSMFSGPKKPDTSAQEAMLKQQQASLDAEEEKQKKIKLAADASKRARTGSSLLAGQDITETDQTKRTTLG